MKKSKVIPMKKQKQLKLTALKLQNNKEIKPNKKQLPLVNKLSFIFDDEHKNKINKIIKKHKLNSMADAIRFCIEVFK